MDVSYRIVNMRPANVNKTGSAMRKKRKALGLTLKELAARARTTEGAVSHIERGIRRPSAEMLARLAGALDCSIDNLLMGVVAEAKKGQHIARVVNAMGAFSPSVQKQVVDYCTFLRYQNRKSSRRPV